LARMRWPECSRCRLMNAGLLLDIHPNADH
jgi:hypothetical protein